MSNTHRVVLRNRVHLLHDDIVSETEKDNIIRFIYKITKMRNEN